MVISVCSSDGAQRFLARLHRIYVGARDHQRTAGAYDFAARDQPFAVARRQDVHLVFYGEHARIVRHQGIAGIARGGVADSADDAAMYIAVLLGQFRLVRQRDFTLPRRQVGECRAYPRHHPLAVESWRARAPHNRDLGA